MALSVTSNFSISAGYASNNMRNSQTLMGKSINRISSGLKAFKPSDDIVSFVGGTKLKTDSIGYNMLSTGVQDAAAKLNMADGVLADVSNGLLELKAQAVAYQSLSDKGTGTDEVKNLQANFDKTLDTLKALTSAPKYKNDKLFFTATASASVVLNAYYGWGSGTSNALQIGGTYLAFKTSSATGFWATGTGSAKVRLDNLTGIQNKIAEITSRRSQLGGNISALETISNYLANAATSADAAYTAVTEVDMAREMTAYVKNNIQSQAAQAMVAQANQGLAQVLNLLQV